jgi:hypothetical protein
MAHSVFLIYSQKDKQTAVAACKALEADDVRVWVAPRDVVPGAKWAESITEAIGQARVMVLIFSPPIPPNILLAKSTSPPAEN